MFWFLILVWFILFSFPNTGQNLWFVYDTVEELDKLMNSLHPQGVRESALKAEIKKRWDDIVKHFTTVKGYVLWFYNVYKVHIKLCQFIQIFIFTFVQWSWIICQLMTTFHIRNSDTNFILFFSHFRIIPKEENPFEKNLMAAFKKVIFFFFFLFPWYFFFSKQKCL